MFVGIDFGTTKSVVAAYRNGTATVLPDEKGNRFTPSVVAVLPDGTRRIGWDAANLPPAVRWSSRFHNINAIKRSLGHQGATRWGSCTAFPQEIAGLILSRLKIQAEARLGEPISGVVLAAPAYFNLSERWALREAAELAGLPVRRVIHEPTAAALAYRLQGMTDKRVAVFDLGGGTFDISVLEIGDGVYEVKATKGDTRLGGIDFTEAIAQHVRAEFKRGFGIDLGGHPEAVQRLTEAAETAKCELSSQGEVTIRLPYLVPGSHSQEFACTLSRAQFEKLTESLRQRVAACCTAVLADAGLRASQIEKVILIGAATRTPSIVALAAGLFGKDLLCSLPLTETVAVGACLHAAALEGILKDVLLLDVAPMSVGIATRHAFGNEANVATRLIDRNTTIPTRGTQVFTTTENNQTEVSIRVVQGEERAVSSNVVIGTVTLRGLAPLRQGEPQIEVCFDIDADGVLQVTAKDLGTGNHVSAVLTRPECCLNPGQVKLLSEKISAEIGSLAESLRHDKARDEAEGFQHSLAHLAQLADGRLSQGARQLLLDGERLLREYLDRGSSAEDLSSLVARVKPHYHHCVTEWCLSTLDGIGTADAFGRWTVESGAELTPAKSASAWCALRGALSAEFRAANLAFDYARSEAAMPTEPLLNMAAADRKRRLCLEMVAACGDFPELAVPDWAATDGQSDDLLRAVLLTLLERGRSSEKRVGAASRLLQWSKETDLELLLTAVLREREPAVAETICQGVFRTFGEALAVFYLSQDEPGRLRFKAHPLLRRVFAQSAIPRLGGAEPARALAILEDVGISGLESALGPALLRLADTTVLPRLASVVAREKSREATVVLIDLVGRFPEVAGTVALDALRGREAMVRDVFLEVLRQPASRDRLLASLTVVRTLKIRDCGQAVLDAWDPAWAESLKLDLLQTTLAERDDPPISQLFPLLADPSVVTRDLVVNILTRSESRWDPIQSRLFKLTQKVFEGKKRPNVLDRMFLKQIDPARPEWALAQSLLSRRK